MAPKDPDRPRRRTDPASHAGNTGPLRRSTSRLDAAAVEPEDAAWATDRLSALTHELANLLDGSMRCLSLARRALPRRDNESTDDPAPPTTPADDAVLAKRLAAVQSALESMAALVRSVSRGSGAGAGYLRLGIDPARRLPEAAEHAAEVMRAVAQSRGIEISCDTDPGLDDLPAGPLYPVIAGAIRNAIESIDVRNRSSGTREPRGAILVSARRVGGGSPRSERLIVEIADDGMGPPAPGDALNPHVFQPGFTTKPRGLGLGLAIAWNIVVDELAGVVELLDRPLEPELPGSSRPGGALLRINCPIGSLVRTPPAGHAGNL